MIKIPQEYLATIPKEHLKEFTELVNTGEDDKINEAFMRFSTLGKARSQEASANLTKAVLELKKLYQEGAEELGSSELIPGTRKERFSDTFRIVKEDIVKRFETITGGK